MPAVKKIYLPSICLFLFLYSSVSRASFIEFHFTGQLTVQQGDGALVDQAAIDSTFSYDTNLGVGSGNLVVSPITFFGLPLQMHTISMQRVDGGNLILGNMLADFGTNYNLPVSMVWDATGLINAIDLGMQAGDVISGTTMKRDGEFFADVNSAIPASDSLPALNQGAAPLATTIWNTTALCTPGVDCIGNAFSGGLGFTDDGISGSSIIDGPFTGINVSKDIGSGNSLTVLSVSAVPVPAAVWLFGSGLVGLLAVARRKKV